MAYMWNRLHPRITPRMDAQLNAARSEAEPEVLDRSRVAGILPEANVISYYQKGWLLNSDPSRLQFSGYLRDSRSRTVWRYVDSNTGEPVYLYGPIEMAVV